MKELLFITKNEHKLSEVKAILGSRYKVISLGDMGYQEEIPEPFNTIQENSIHKATYFFDRMQISCISEDSGLEVRALCGAPGALSARYAGEEKNDVKNWKKLLLDMEDKVDREARFLSVFSFATEDGTIYSFEGEMRGIIARESKGVNGFGYDPIFISEGEVRTNAELSSEEKNAKSHRRKALDKLITYLHSQ